MNRYLCILISLFLSAICGHAAPAADFWHIATPQELPFDTQVISQTEEDGMVWKQIYFTSQVVNGVPYRIFAIYAAPKGTVKTAAVLYIHGAGGTADPDIVKAFVTRGYPCLSFDWSGNLIAKPKPGQQPRPPRVEYSKFGALTAVQPPPANYQSPPENSRAHLALIAARRAISWMQQQPEVDPDKIGAMGESWGGLDSLILNGIEDRLKAVVDVYGAGYYQQFGVNGGCFGVTGSLQKLPREQQVDWLNHFDPQHYVPQAHAPLYLITGTNDMFFPLPLVIQTYAALPVEKRLWLVPNVNHSLAKGVTPAAAALWFDHYLRGTGQPLPDVKIADVTGSKVSFNVQPEGFTPKTAELTWLWMKDPVNNLPAVYGYAAKDKVWESTAATKSGANLWQASLPAAPAGDKTVGVYATVETADGFKASSPVKWIPAPSGDVSPKSAASAPEAAQ